MASLPLELYNEFISYLWDDRTSLSACSLAGRALTVASQKRIFYRVILTDADSRWHLTGTSSAFHRLLKSSAKYVQCLQIFDIIESESDSLSDGTWLSKDTFLPLFSPLLCNLKAFTAFFMPNWNLLSEQVRRSLHDLIRLPSLVYVDIAPRPAILLKESFGDNLKHLILREDRSTISILPEPSCSSPIYLETLFMAAAESTFLTRLTSDPDLRFKTSQLRSLLLDIQADDTSQDSALWPLLHSCRGTLEQFTFIACINFLSMDDISALQSTSIDLSQLTALKTLTLYFDTSFGIDEWDPLWCFKKLLSSTSSTCQRLENITVIMELYGRTFEDLSHWDDTCQVLLNPIRWPRLRKLSIGALDSWFSGGVSPFLALLEDSESMRKLRARPGMEVVTMGVDDGTVELELDAPDERWKNVVCQSSLFEIEQN